MGPRAASVEFLATGDESTSLCDLGVTTPALEVERKAAAAGEAFSRV